MVYREEKFSEPWRREGAGGQVRPSHHPVFVQSGRKGQWGECRAPLTRTGACAQVVTLTHLMDILSLCPTLSGKRFEAKGVCKSV